MESDSLIPHQYPKLQNPSPYILLCILLWYEAEKQKSNTKSNIEQEWVALRVRQWVKKGAGEHLIITNVFLQNNI